MLKMELHIPKETVDRENRRDLRNMDADDLLWCFGVDIDIYTNDADSRITCNEITMFDFAIQIGELREELLLSLSDIFYKIEDKDGMYTFEISRDGEFLTITEVASDQTIRSTTFELADAIRSFIESVVLRSQEVFPNLDANPSYTSLIKNLGKFGTIAPYDKP